MTHIGHSFRFYKDLPIFQDIEPNVYQKVNNNGTQQITVSINLYAAMKTKISLKIVKYM